MGQIQLLLINAVDKFFWVIEILILIRVILSWVPMRSNGPIITLVYDLTEPILGPAKRMLDKSPLGGGMMIDFSPIIALFMMGLLKQIILALLMLI